MYMSYSQRYSWSYDYIFVVGNVGFIINIK